MYPPLPLAARIIQSSEGNALRFAVAALNGFDGKWDGWLHGVLWRLQYVVQQFPVATLLGQAKQN